MASAHEKRELDAAELARLQVMQDFLDNAEAEYRMMGLPEREAKEKAMSDWYTYRCPD